MQPRQQVGALLEGRRLLWEIALNDLSEHGVLGGSFPQADPVLFIEQGRAETFSRNAGMTGPNVDDQHPDDGAQQFDVPWDGGTTAPIAQPLRGDHCGRDRGDGSAGAGFPGRLLYPFSRSGQGQIGCRQQLVEARCEQLSRVPLQLCLFRQLRGGLLTAQLGPLTVPPRKLGLRDPARAQEG
ncbi:hypothetical protein ACFYYP_32945 [Microbispora rosea]|uniref:hypothetical protein n=1 Tax=Microbispora rosea TaxID=58117 RepID=UPI0036784849